MIRGGYQLIRIRFDDTLLFLLWLLVFRVGVDGVGGGGFTGTSAEKIDKVIRNSGTDCQQFKWKH